MKRVIAYIDGYNLYYGLLKGTPYKWLDLEAFVSTFLREDQELIAIKYFTAPVKTHPHDTAAIDRQKIYLQALGTLPRVKVIQGFYAKNKTLAPALANECTTCSVARNGFIPVVKLEEKRSDVNLAIEMVMDATTNAADSFFLFTGDSDQIGTIETLRNRLGKTVCVFNPHEGLSANLKQAASYYRNIQRDLPSQCQLPDTIQLGTGNQRIHRPAAWTARP